MHRASRSANSASVCFDNRRLTAALTCRPESLVKTMRRPMRLSGVPVRDSRDDSVAIHFSPSRSTNASALMTSRIAGTIAQRSGEKSRGDPQVTVARHLDEKLVLSGAAAFLDVALRRPGALRKRRQQCEPALP